MPKGRKRRDEEHYPWETSETEGVEGVDSAPETAQNGPELNDGAEGGADTPETGGIDVECLSAGELEAFGRMIRRLSSALQECTMQLEQIQNGIHVARKNRR